MLTVLKTLFTTLSLSLLLSSCTSQSLSQPTLYDKLGGQKGVDAIVNSFITQIGRDKQILPYFSDARISHFREKITAHFCMLADGPCLYEGDTMIDIHTGMHINESDFNRVVDLLIKAMDEQRIPHRIQNQLLLRLAPLRSDITYK
jgi:hemoglobin